MSTILFYSTNTFFLFERLDIIRLIIYYISFVTSRGERREPNLKGVYVRRDVSTIRTLEMSEVRGTRDWWRLYQTK